MIPKSVCAVLAAAALLPWLLGCRSRSVVRVQARITQDDLAAGLDAPNNAHLLLDHAVTVGRFACGLAIAKFDPRGEGFEPDLQLSDISPAEQARWDETFRGIASIRELIFLSRTSSQGGRRDPTALCMVARRLGAPLLLIYSPNRHGPNTAQVLGVLYEARDARPIATLHAAARFVDRQGNETPPERRFGDQRERDAGYQAARAFERHALSCLFDLVDLDSTPATTQPHDWQKPWPERWWVPQVIKRK